MSQEKYSIKEFGSVNIDQLYVNSCIVPVISITSGYYGLNTVTTGSSNAFDNGSKSIVPNAGGLFVLNNGDGCNVFLPAPRLCAGASYTFIVGQTGGHVINTPNTCIYGTINGVITTTQGNCTLTDNNGDTISTSGNVITSISSNGITASGSMMLSLNTVGNVGDRVNLISDGSNYYVSGNVGNITSVSFM